MIQFVSQEVSSFLEWLTQKQPCNIPVFMIPLYGYDHIETDEGEGFACYNRNKGGRAVMFIPMDLDHETVLECIAHEYTHHIQACEYRKSDEKEAEQKAIELVEEYALEQRTPG